MILQRSPSSSLASSVIISCDHSGSKTRLTLTVVSPSIVSSFRRTSSLMKSAMGQEGAVMVIDVQLREVIAEFDAIDEPEVIDVHGNLRVVNRLQEFDDFFFYL